MFMLNADHLIINLKQQAIKKSWFMCVFFFTKYSWAIESVVVYFYVEDLKSFIKTLNITYNSHTTWLISTSCCED